MLTTVDEFRTTISTNVGALIAELQALTGRYGSEEAAAWDRSLTQLNRIFQADSFKPLHLYFGSRGDMSLEYQLPASSAWCDVVLLGSHQNRPSAVIVELKDWQTAGDEPGGYEGLVWRQGADELHPSDQVRGYTEYCRRFHSAVQDYSAAVHGCVLFTRDRWTDAYTAEPNAKLSADYPLFTTSQEDVKKAFPSFFQQRLTQPDERFARAFEGGKYRQHRGFVAQIGAQILDPTASAFELLDGQRKAFALCSSTIRKTFHHRGKGRPRKRVVIVKGPPGSGKSAIAARLWATLVTDEQLPEGDVVMTTTSASQNRNWAWLFERASKERGARGVVRKATAFTPIDTQHLGRLRSRKGKGFLSDAGKWRHNFAQLRALGVPFRDSTEDNANLVSIVDEAHALINPEHSDGRGQFGFVVSVGPQAYHIIRSSFLTVFLLDPLQGFRQRENTSMEDLRKWSHELGAGDPVEISLEGLQFRCAGSSEYVTWIESLLAGERAPKNAKRASLWHGTLNSALRSTPLGRNRRFPTMEFRLFDEPESWESALQARVDEGSSVRLLSSYSRAWKTKSAKSPHQIEARQMDFHEQYRVGNRTKYWSRIWNYVPGGSDYTWFVAGHPASFIAKDPLCEVGCPYAVRGFDYDYVGLLWLDDLIWRNGAWQVDPTKVHESGHGSLLGAAQKEAKRGEVGDASRELQEKVAQAYRILLTRALRGVYLWVPDTKTRVHLAESLGREGL